MPLSVLATAAGIAVCSRAARALRRPAEAALGRSTDMRIGTIVLLLAVGSLAALPMTAVAQSPELNVEGMTFVASRAGENEMVLHATHARFETDEEMVFLRVVRMVVEPSDYSGSFEIFCDEGQLDMATNDFEAIGNVHGTTDGGRTFRAPWVRYDHENGLLFTNAPVLINEDAISYRGGGFQYYVRTKRFRLLGGASVVQEQ